MISQPIRESLNEFATYVMQPGVKTHYGLLVLCDRVITVYNNSSEDFDDQEYPDPPSHDYTETRKLISGLFPDFGHYNLPERVLDTIGESPIMVGDAIDDISDIVEDFRKILWRFDITSDADAIWHFRFGYSSHWGIHMRELQFYLFRKESGN